MRQPLPPRKGSEQRSTSLAVGWWTVAAIFLLLMLGACGDSGGDEAEEGAAEQGTDESGADADDTEQAAGDDAGESAGDEPSEGASGDLPEGAVADIAGLVTSESSACAFDEVLPLPVRPVCHTVTVPENWDDPDPDDQVVLQVAVFEGDGTNDDPYIYFDGGPGAETLDVLSLTFPVLVEPLVGERDFIFFDQRGIGNSEPALDCPELLEVAYDDLRGNIAADDIFQVTLDAQEGCVDRLESSGVDLTRYNSIASANDAEAIRVALGYEQVNPIGVSYGTRLGQTYMRLYPGSIRSIVLDSVFPTAANLWTDFGPGAERAFEQMFDGCAASPACAETYPDFENDFFAMLDQLDAAPHQASISNLLTGETFEGPMDGDDAMALTFSALYSRGLFSVIPAMTDEVLDGKYTSLELLGSNAVTQLEFVATGLQLSVECNEELAFESDAEREANLSSDVRYERLEALSGQPNFFDSCEAWPSGAAPEVENETVASEVPTLLLAGEYDPITPPAGMDLIAAGLTTSYQVTLPHEGHGITITPCGAEIVASFVDEPTVEPDSSCVADSPSPAFAPGSEEAQAIDLVEYSSEGLINISGVRPEGWTEAGPGVFARSTTALDPTVVLMQPTQGQPAEAIAALAGGQLGFDLMPNGTVDVEGESWRVFTAGNDQGQAEMLIREGQDGVVALLVTAEGEFDSLRAEVLLPMAAAAKIP